MADRDDASMRHFTSRAAQPKGLVAAVSSGTQPNRATNGRFDGGCDGGFGGGTDQLSGIDFRYTGTSPNVSAYEAMRTRKSNMNNSRSVFDDIRG